MSDLAATDPMRALRSALSRMRHGLQLVAGESAHFPGIEQDLQIAERALLTLERGGTEPGGTDRDP